MSEQPKIPKNVEAFDYTDADNEGKIVEIPLTTLQSIRDKAKSAGEDITSFLEEGATADLMEAVAKAAYIVGAAKYYLGEDE